MKHAKKLLRLHHGIRNCSFHLQVRSRLWQAASVARFLFSFWKLVYSQMGPSEQIRRRLTVAGLQFSHASNAGNVKKGDEKFPPHALKTQTDGRKSFQMQIRAMLSFESFYGCDGSHDICEGQVDSAASLVRPAALPPIQK